MKLTTLFKAQVAVVIAVLLLVGCATMESGQSARATANDATITTKVKSNFVADPLVTASAINVDTSGGVVSLTGFVNSEQERQRAIQLAQSVAGVRQVNARNLVVKR